MVFLKKNNLQIIESPPLRDQVADIVRTKILSGELESGQPISERVLSTQLNVSTTPVKEAFRTLSAEGLLYVKPRKGSYVSSISNEYMQQIVYMRSAAEGVAAYYATSLISAEEIHMLEEIIEDLSVALSQEIDIDMVRELNTQFHSIIRCACRNNYLIHLCNSMNAIDRRVRDLSFYTDDEEPYRAFEEHKDIMLAIKAGDPAVTEAKMVSHIRRVARLVLGSSKED